MAEYRLSPAAQDDLDGIFDYTVREWGLAQAVRYTRLLEDICAAVAQAPSQGQECGHIRPGYRRHAVEHHFIYYVATDYGIAVIRILHGRMLASLHL
ncbi:MAG: type II toxin-antitoxin system RelE/ParE family toxin [Steroidobacteraceae bacterium]